MSTSLTRRALLRGAPGRAAQRPPWTAADFTDTCTRCTLCIEACPEQLLARGDGGFPEISFQEAGCSFCEFCAQACEAGVFDLRRPAFSWRASISDRCLPLGNIDCRACQDTCEPAAIRFVPTLGRPAQPSLSLDDCTGCGACVAVCPNDAISLETGHV